MADSKKYEGSQWEHSLRKQTTASEIIVPPTTIYCDGSNITTYTIKGNTVQNGTPTPSNPVEVNGVGERTENLWNESYTEIKIDVITYKPLNVGDGDYTLSSTVTMEGQAAVLFLLAGNVSSGATSVNNGVWNGQSRTVTAVNGYITIGYRKYTEANPENANTMLNSGSTAKPYEPYGYKIPISSPVVTTNIYLGSTQTVRQIKKLVLTGSEDYWYSGANTWLIIGSSAADFRGTSDGAICSHLPLVARSEFSTNTCAWGGGQIGDLLINIDNKNMEDLKAYLAQQYAAGTPVTVWYVLATPQTAAVNEPLMKIGTYVDTLSNAASIPTTEGANSITVDTTVQPSEFTATWTGWHDATVKEWDGSDWQ